MIFIIKYAYSGQTVDCVQCAYKNRTCTSENREIVQSRRVCGTPERWRWDSQGFPLYGSPELTTAFIAISLIPLIIVGIIVYHSVKKGITADVLNHLESVASIQKNRINVILDRNRERLSLVVSRTQLRLSLNSYINNPKEVYRNKINRILYDTRSSIGDFHKISRDISRYM